MHDSCTLGEMNFLCDSALDFGPRSFVRVLPRFQIEVLERDSILHVKNLARNYTFSKLVEGNQHVVNCAQYVPFIEQTDIPSLSAQLSLSSKKAGDRTLQLFKA